MEHQDLILFGGTVVSGEEHHKADVGIKHGKIQLIAADLSQYPATEKLDISGRFLLPGIIDVHVHPVYTDDIEYSSYVAAFGGTTTLLHFIYARPGQDLLPVMEQAIEEAERSSRLDFGLHCGLFEAPKQAPQIKDVLKLGVRSFKFFMTYLKQGWYTDDYQLIKAMDILAEHGGLPMVHAENGGGIDYLEDKYLTGPQASWKNFNISRPAVLEEEAIFRAICLAEVTGCPLYIPHVTAERALRPIRAARERGQVVYGETCAHYLSLTEKILEERGALAKVGPPIRTENDRQALWQALADRTLQVVASDHAAKLKDPQGDFIQQGFGSPQLETLFPVTYDEGVNQGRISLQRLVQVMCENPAKIFGLYPQKGVIRQGSDADLVVLNPEKSFTIQADNQHSHVGYTLYEGRAVKGWPEMTFQRGQKVLDHDQVVASPGSGSFLPVSPSGKFI